MGMEGDSVEKVGKQCEQKLNRIHNRAGTSGEASGSGTAPSVTGAGWDQQHSLGKAAG